MSKTVDIEYCGDCPHRFYKGNDMKCDKTDKLTAKNAPIPEWCPLPDSKPYKYETVVDARVKAENFVDLASFSSGFASAREHKEG